MANITLKTSLPQGALYSTRDGTQYTVGAGGLLTIVNNPINLRDAIDNGFQPPEMYGSVAAGLTALAAGGQTGATQLSYGLNQVATVATAADSVALPAAVPGEFVTVINDAALPCQVFGLGADTVNGIAADAALPCQVFGLGADTVNGIAAATGIQQLGNTTCTYWCVVAGQWRVSPGVGASGSVPILGTAANGLTANASLGQANGLALTAAINRVTTAGAINASVKLPASLPGMRIRVTNANAANAVGVFPVSGESITPGATDAIFSIPANKSADFVSAVAGKWDAVLSA